MTEKQPFSKDGNIVGVKIHDIRSRRRLSLRELSEKSGLSITTICLVEKGKSSPSVSTLQQLARAMEIPITAFFESEPTQKNVVFTAHDKRPQTEFKSTRLENLGKDFAGNAFQPFVVTLPPKTGSGVQMIVHIGIEFVYCLSGKIRYQIDQTRYLLEQGHSLVFESTIPHRWENLHDSESQMILAFIPTDQQGDAGGHHFPNQ